MKTLLYGPDNTPLITTRDETERQLATLARQRNILVNLVLDGYMLLSGRVPKDLRPKSTSAWLGAIADIFSREQIEGHVAQVQAGFAHSKEAKKDRGNEGGERDKDSSACKRCGGKGYFVMQVHHDDCDDSEFCSTHCPCEKRTQCKQCQGPPTHTREVPPS